MPPRIIIATDQSKNHKALMAFLGACTGPETAVQLRIEPVELRKFIPACSRQVYHQLHRHVTESSPCAVLLARDAECQTEDDWSRAKARATAFRDALQSEFARTPVCIWLLNPTSEGALLHFEDLCTVIGEGVGLTRKQRLSVDELRRDKLARRAVSKRRLCDLWSFGDGTRKTEIDVRAAQWFREHPRGIVPDAVIRHAVDDLRAAVGLGRWEP